MKALPFDTKTGFAAMPSAIYTIYTMHPKVQKTSAIAVYGYLIMRYNAEYGYAFPSLTDIAQTLHLSDSTTQRAIKALKELELIKVERNPEFNNNVYYLLKPIESYEEFIAKFPEVKEAEEKHVEKWDKINGSRKEAKEKHQAKAKKGTKKPVEKETDAEPVEKGPELEPDLVDADWF
ncbi:helix-turn-helix domain-containing protein [Peribacillus frigoritolerans]|uniref:helix-turn-helix domain-containing protein n=1 Tax=Peribacillus frigoritolerans TaxID=450367 RepID=UPI0035CFA2FA